MEDTKYIELSERIDKLEKKQPNPLQFAVEDTATTESIINILRKKCGITNEEIRENMNIYGSVLSAILNILYNKNLATPDDIQNEVMAFHHVMRLRGLESSLTYEQITAERDKFIEDLRRAKMNSVAFK